MAKPAKFIGEFYQLGDAIGKGAFGTVYKALNIRSGDFVAIKQIPIHNISDEQSASIKMEINLLKKLKHDNIVKYVEIITSAGVMNIVLEYVESGSLANITKKFGSFPESLVAIYVTQVLKGLGYLHEQGVIHRDIKGANILITKEGFVKLADFGVATKLSEAEKSNSVVGTPYWMAPEIIEMCSPTTACDIWSVGCVVVELLTGHPPYYDLAPMPALFRIVRDEYPPLPEDISPALKNFLLQCFQKDPALRVDAPTLLRHQWINNPRNTVARTMAVTSQVDLPEEVTNTIRLHMENEKLTSPDSKTAPRASIASAPVNTDNNLDRWNDDDDDDAWAAEPVTVIHQGPLKHEDVTPRVTPPPHANRSVSPVTPVPLMRIEKPSSARVSHSDHDGSVIFNSSNGSLQLNRQKSCGDLNDDSSDFSDDEDMKAKAVQGPSGLVLTRLTTMSVPSGATNINMLGTGASALTQYQEVADEDDDFGSEEESSGVNLAQILQRKGLGANANQAIHHGPSHSSGSVNAILSPHPSDMGSPMSFRGPRSNVSVEGGEDLADKLKAKMNTQWDATVEQLFDEIDFDWEPNRDVNARQSAEIQKLLGQLKPDDPAEGIINACNRLIEIFKESPGSKTHLITHHGVVPLLEMLEVSNQTVLHYILQVINQIIEHNRKFQENLSLVGLIPAVVKFASGKYSKSIRIEAAYFVGQICHTSPVTLQMFIACGALPVLVEFVEPNYDDHRDLVWTAIDCIWRVFEVQTIPKNDFCRLFGKMGLLERLMIALHNVNSDRDPRALQYLDRVANIFVLFSQGDHVVKTHFADEEVLGGIMTALDSLPVTVLVKMLKVIKNLTMDPNTLNHLENAGAIPKLVGFLAKRDGAHITEIHNQVLQSCFYLCKINRARQEQAALAGITPHLLYIISTHSPLKQLALPIFCDLAHASRAAREELWNYNGIECYLDLLTEPYWQLHALDAIASWLAVEPKRVESILLRPISLQKIISLFRTAQKNIIENLLDILHRVVVSCSKLNQALGQSKLFVNEVVQRLAVAESITGPLGPEYANPKPIVRLNLLKILHALCEQHPDKKELISSHHLYTIVSNISEDENMVILVELANQLLEMFSHYIDPPTVSISRSTVLV
eukprot:GILK01006971.1.p1 GENE.GILK01006971.1~~GILK01006971.1.p1  ORF type:complete len:1130 (+),score=224.67 GILK01006971.1:94-3483(+)